MNISHLVQPSESKKGSSLESPFPLRDGETLEEVMAMPFNERVKHPGWYAFFLNSIDEKRAAHWDALPGEVKLDLMQSVGLGWGQCTWWDFSEADRSKLFLAARGLVGLADQLRDFVGLVD